MRLSAFGLDLLYGIVLRGLVHVLYLYLRGALEFHGYLI